MNLILISVFLGNLTVTSYRSEINQTDASPFHTSTGQRVRLGGAAVSQDMLCGACRKLHGRCKHPEYPSKLHYGDQIYIKDLGFKVINDCMGLTKTYKIKTNKGYKRVFKKQLRALDLWVPFKEDEKAFHKKYGINKHETWLIKLSEEERYGN